MAKLDTNLGKDMAKLPTVLVKNVVGNAELGKTQVSATSRPTLKVSSKKK